MFEKPQDLIGKNIWQEVSEEFRLRSYEAYAQALREQKFVQLNDTEATSALFKVQDQGRGIPADKIEVIFERFHQVDASDSRKQGGTGLGLAICRSIVEQHNGQIWVESTPGVGSSFYMKLPQ